MKKLAYVAAAAALAVGGVGTASAQLGDLGRLVGQAAGKLGADKLLGNKVPITTSLADAVHGDPQRDGWTPREPKRPLDSLRRTEAGGFVLGPGFFEFSAQSYCLHAGTHGPGGGDGYLYAPTKGAAEPIVVAILRNSVDHPEVSQQRIQALIWTLLSRSKLEDMNTDLQATARTLLDARELKAISKTALEMIPPEILNRALAEAPPLVRQALAAEAQLRSLASRPGTTFREMESVAVLAGMAPRGPGSQTVAEGRWSRHPDGYLIRYLPRGYSHTVVQIHVEPGSAAIGRTYDPATHVAVPGNTSRQRLAQSGRAKIA
ncbi:hypothetical protein [Qipengyuania sediminis]|uniref:hypothetical protein n=1 Tax=Qipengyuania sediminis TaxID=1532023 RepID=UPI001059B013|nr:hypothetical protein [Qipengyuania sediminis]